MPSPLEKVIGRLQITVSTVPFVQRNNRCLKFTRLAIEAEGMRVPRRDFANQSGRALVANPQAFGWQRVRPPLPRFTLDYYDGGGIGRLSDGRIAGHVGVVDREEGTIFSAVPFPLTQRFKDHRFASFVPLANSAGGPLLASPVALAVPEAQELTPEELERLLDQVRAGDLDGEGELLDLLFGAQQADDGAAEPLR